METHTQAILAVCHGAPDLFPTQKDPDEFCFVLIPFRNLKCLVYL